MHHQLAYKKTFRGNHEVTVRDLLTKQSILSFILQNANQSIEFGKRVFINIRLYDIHIGWGDIAKGIPTPQVFVSIIGGALTGVGGQFGTLFADIAYGGIPDDLGLSTRTRTHSH